MKQRRRCRGFPAPGSVARLPALLGLALAAGAFGGCSHLWHPQTSDSPQATAEAQSFDSLYQ